MTPELSHENILLEWVAPEFNDLKRGPVWYGVAGSIVVLFILYGFLSCSWTFVMAILALVVVFLMTHQKGPKQIQVQITDMGVHYGKDFYAYNHLKSFWLVYHLPYVHCLYLELAGKKEKILRVQLNHQNPVPLRALLSREVAEREGGGEPVFDTFSRILRLQ